MGQSGDSNLASRVARNRDCCPASPGQQGESPPRHPPDEPPCLPEEISKQTKAPQKDHEARVCQQGTNGKAEEALLKGLQARRVHHCVQDLESRDRD